jgi:hypothetical protein
MKAHIYKICIYAKIDVKTSPLQLKPDSYQTLQDETNSLTPDSR